MIRFSIRRTLFSICYFSIILVKVHVPGTSATFEIFRQQVWVLLASTQYPLTSTLYIYSRSFTARLPLSVIICSLDEAKAPNSIAGERLPARCPRSCYLVVIFCPLTTDAGGQNSFFVVSFHTLSYDDSKEWIVAYCSVFLRVYQLLSFLAVRD